MLGSWQKTLNLHMQFFGCGYSRLIHLSNCHYIGIL